MKPSGGALSGPDILPRFYYSTSRRAFTACVFQACRRGTASRLGDFPLSRRPSPSAPRDSVRRQQHYDLEQIDHLSRGRDAQLVGTDAAFGFTLGDLVGDDLSLFEPLNRAIARIGVPWYAVIGNHDMNYDAHGDEDSDESYERVYGPSTYAFEYARAHFLVLDDVVYGGASGERSSQNYRGGFSQDQLAFLRAYLAEVPRDHLVVALMHMPIAGPAPFGFEQGRELLALLSDRPNTLSFSSHTHMQYQALSGPEAALGRRAAPPREPGRGAGSWWLGAKDELGIPHATMRWRRSNGWSILEIDGARFRLRFQAARARPAIK